MVANPEDGLVTDLMLGLMIAFGFDIVLLLCVFWIAGFVSLTAFVGATAVIVCFYAAWIGYRWWGIRTVEETELDPLDELKRRYANGELSEAQFEAKLETVMDDPVQQDAVERDEPLIDGQQRESVFESER